MDQSFKYLKEEIIDNATIIVGVSGGPDSMALLYLLQQLQREKNIKIVCAHVNHNSGRKGQITDQYFVEQYCQKNNLTFELFTIEKYTEKNFHNEAHKKRYDFFEKLIKKYNAKYLLTAHHGDDLIETILMRIVRGSTLKGYIGFEEKIIKENYTILRPLVFTTKEEILKFNTKNNIEYVIDDSNHKDIYTRNRYRKYIIPKLKEEDYNVHMKFYKFHKMLNEVNEFIEYQVDKIFNDIYVEDKLNLQKFNRLESILKVHIIERILKNIYQEDLYAINNKHIDLIIDLSNKLTNSKITLPKNIEIIKEYDYMIFKKISNPTPFKIKIISGEYLLENGNKIKVLDEEKIQTDNYICRLSKNDVVFPLFIRNRKNGDKIEIKNLNGTKKVKEIFIENKISKLERENYPIIVDSKDTIVWIPGLKKSKYDKQITEKYDIILKYY